MKKVSLLFLTMAVYLFFPHFALSGEKAGDIVSVKGDTRIERGTRVITAAMKLELYENDTVSTMEKSRAKILFRDDSILTLGEKSKLIVRQYLYDQENKRAESVFEILEGKLRSVVGNADFKVKTPTALAAARGTIFLIWHDNSAKSTGIAVIEGEVGVKNADPSVEGLQLLKAGMMTIVKKGEPPRTPQTMGGIIELKDAPEESDIFEIDLVEVEDPVENIPGMEEDESDSDTINTKNIKGPKNTKSRGLYQDQLPNPGKRLGQGQGNGNGGGNNNP